MDDVPAALFRTRAWRAHTLDTDEDEAAARFRARYGRPPEYIVERRGLLWVGPAPEEPAGERGGVRGGTDAR